MIGWKHFQNYFAQNLAKRRGLGWMENMMNESLWVKIGANINI